MLTGESKMGFPSENELKNIRKKLSRTTGTVMLSKDATVAEKFRWDLCQEFIKYANKNELKNSELAKLLKIHESDVSKILHHRIQRIGTDKLMKLLLIICPAHKLIVKAA